MQPFFSPPVTKIYGYCLGNKRNARNYWLVKRSLKNRYATPSKGGQENEVSGKNPNIK